MTHPAHRDEYSAPWFDGLLDDRLLIRRCLECSRYCRPDCTACTSCASDHLEWVEAAGTGTVITIVIDHSVGEPLTLGLVELDEGPWMHVRLTRESVAGDRVLMAVEHSPVGEPIPTFRRQADLSGPATRLDTEGHDTGSR